MYVWVYICTHIHGFIGLTYKIKGSVVQQWSPSCRDREPCNYLGQESGKFRTRGTNDIIPAPGWRPGSFLESPWCKSMLKGWRSWSPMSIGDGSINRLLSQKSGICNYWIAFSSPTFISVYWMVLPHANRILLPKLFSHMSIVSGKSLRDTHRSVFYWFPRHFLILWGWQG
jgi:hypothetical protein